MRKTSEWVSVGHPDKMADYISCYLLDRHLERDPYTRFAVEVQIKDEFVSLGGEVTSRAGYSEDEIAAFVRRAVNRIGYTREYQQTWGRDNVACGDDLVVSQHIGVQSPDIAVGVDNDGWGDQGIFHGLAVRSPNTGNMPMDWFLAKAIGMSLYRSGYAGIDIKTQVTLDGDEVEEVVVAIPMLGTHSEEYVRRVADETARQHGFSGIEAGRISVNGTGRYVRHGSVGDCGTTGRKLAVDFYGGNCVIGGGSPWTKDGTKADLSLNLLARERASSYLNSHSGTDEVRCALSCRIGSPEVLAVFMDGKGQELESTRETVFPKDVMDRFRLREPIYCEMCERGLFG